MLFRSYCTPYMVVIYDTSTITCNILSITWVLATMMLTGFCITYSILLVTLRVVTAAEIPTFRVLICRNVYGFVQRCLTSRNNWISLS